VAADLTNQVQGVTSLVIRGPELEWQFDRLVCVGLGIEPILVFGEWFATQGPWRFLFCLELTGREVKSGFEVDDGVVFAGYHLIN